MKKLILFFTILLLTTINIEAKENIGMRVIDTPNAFIKKQQPENQKVIISIRGIMDEIMCIIAPDIYQPCVQLYRGNKVFYVQ